MHTLDGCSQVVLKSIPYTDLIQQTILIDRRNNAQMETPSSPTSSLNEPSCLSYDTDALLAMFSSIPISLTPLETDHYTVFTLLHRIPKFIAALPFPPPLLLQPAPHVLSQSLVFCLASKSHAFQPKSPTLVFNLFPKKHPS